jgi:hypothetical protein
MTRAWFYRRTMGGMADGDPGSYAPPFLICLLVALIAYPPWRSIFYWLFIFLVASMIAVGLLAAFQPLYDLTHWRIPQ